MAAAAAVYDFGFLKCFSLNKNYLFRFEVSITSGSVIVNLPFLPTPKLIIAKFFNSSHPMAPAPTINNCASCNSFNNLVPTTALRPSVRSGLLSTYISFFIKFSHSVSFYGKSGMTSIQSEYKNCLVGIYF